AFRLYRHFLPLLESRGLMHVFAKIEMPCLRILANMELTGIRVLPAKLQKLSGLFEKELSDLETRIHTEVGHEFNINSPKQLGEILFTERKLPPVKKTKTGFSTDNSVLEQLAAEEADEIPQLILDFRSLAKLKNTYLDTLPRLINKKTARIHTQYMQTGTATGRLSSKDPNLQNIPVKSENGRKIREAFVPEAGSFFISADYSQIELVVLAHLSKDPLLTKAFTEGLDIHKLTAAIIFQTDLDKVTPDQRRMGKTVNFGTVYGMSAFRLARDFKISRREAEEFIEAYFTRYTGVKSFRNHVITEAVKNGYVSTISGRTRKVQAIGSANRTERAGAERIAFNTVIQGSAADIVKIAMIRINDYLMEKGLSTRLLLQVHDELILESPEAESEKIQNAVKSIMEKAMELSVPLRVNIDCGESWGSIH
ncbi:MAG: DNA polymerase I, partial [Spirochaetaceae bacterium]